MKSLLILLLTIVSLNAFSQGLFEKGDSAGTIIGKLIGVGLVIYVIVYFVWLRKKKV